MKPLLERFPEYSNALEGAPFPLLFCDMDLLDRNIRAVRTKAEKAGKNIRIHTKSIRSPELLRYILDRGGSRFRGLMSFGARETAYLAKLGFDDFILAYPIASEEEAATLARLSASGIRIRTMVDSADHVALLERAARAEDCMLEVCVEMDCAWKPFGALHLGLRRSPVRTPEDARGLILALRTSEHVRATALMGYEGHIAGPEDAVPGRFFQNVLVRSLKRLSIREYFPRRGALAAALREAGFPVDTVNGGGSGSLEHTLGDPAVTEVTVGSAFYAPALFWHYRTEDYVPSLFFALRVSRIPGPGFVCCNGGGYIASGPPGPSRLPVPVYPAGLRYVDLEGAGEVQTPLRSSADLGIGDPVYFQHPKAGEPCERFSEIRLLRAGRLEGKAGTYRASGESFI